MNSIDNNFILVSSNGGIYMVNTNTLKFSNYTDNLEYIDINSIAMHNDQFWLAGNDGNIQILDKNLNLDYIIDYTDFDSIRKIVFYNEYAFAIGTDLEGNDVLIQYSAGDNPGYLNYIDINNLLNTIPDCDICPSDNNRINDINIGDHEIAIATTAGFYIADLSNYNHNLLSTALDWSSLFGDEALLIIDNFIYYEYENQINIGYSGADGPFSYPESTLNIVDAEYYDGKLYSLFNNILYISNLDGSGLQTFSLPNYVTTEFEDLLLIDGYIYIGLKNYGIIKIDENLSDIDNIIPNTLFSNNITAIDIKDNHTLAGLSGNAEDRLGGFIIENIHISPEIKNFYSYNMNLSNYPDLNINNVDYIGNSLSYAPGNIESSNIKFNSKGELYFLNSGIYLDPDNYCHDGYGEDIEHISSLIQLDPTSMEIINTWGKDVFVGKRTIYPEVYPNDDLMVECPDCDSYKNHTILNQLFFDNYDNAWIVNPNSEGEINRPICIMLNDNQDDWMFIEDHNNPNVCNSQSISNEYLLPKETVLDDDNNLWIAYEKEPMNPDYSPGGIKVVKVNDISNPNDDKWYTKPEHDNDIHYVVEVDCQDVFDNISVHSIDIGKNDFGHTILWAVTENGIMAYRIFYTEKRYILQALYLESPCQFYFPEYEFDSLSKIRVDKHNNAWAISKKGAIVIHPDSPWDIKFSLDNMTTNLLSNNIQDFVFDDNGYVYFATDKGISIFSTIFGEDKSISSISVSPNPFMIGKDEFLTISNFSSESVIHIMTLSGNVVKKFILDEGNTILNWDGRGDDGRYLNTGVYLVAGFNSSQNEGTTKLAIIRK